MVSGLRVTQGAPHRVSRTIHRNKTGHNQNTRTTRTAEETPHLRARARSERAAAASTRPGRSAFARKSSATGPDVICERNSGELRSDAHARSQPTHACAHTLQPTHTCTHTLRVYTRVCTHTLRVCTRMCTRTLPAYTRVCTHTLRVYTRMCTHILAGDRKRSSSNTQATGTAGGQLVSFIGTAGPRGSWGHAPSLWLSTGSQLPRRDTPGELRHSSEPALRHHHRQDHRVHLAGPR